MVVMGGVVGLACLSCWALSEMEAGGSSAYPAWLCCALLFWIEPSCGMRGDVQQLADAPFASCGFWPCTGTLYGSGVALAGRTASVPPLLFCHCSSSEVYIVILNVLWLLRFFSCGRVVRGMMFGFGDSMPPSPASVRLMEEMVIEYIVALVTKVRCCLAHDCTR